MKKINKILLVATFLMLFNSCKFYEAMKIVYNSDRDLQRTEHHIDVNRVQLEYQYRYNMKYDTRYKTDPRYLRLRYGRTPNPAIYRHRD